MIDPTLELQGAIFARLIDDSGVRALVGMNVLDDVPQGVTLPYVTMGPTEGQSDDAECIPADDITFQIDCWSKAPGFVEVRRIAGAVRRALEAEISLEGNAMVNFQHRQTRVFRDPGGVLSHAAMTFQATIERA